MGREGVVRRGTSSSYIPLDFQTPTKFLISLSISHHHLLIPSNHHHLLMSALLPSSSPATTTKAPCSSSRASLCSAHRLLLFPHRWRTAPTDPNRAESSPKAPAQAAFTHGAPAPALLAISFSSANAVFCSMRTLGLRLVLSLLPLCLLFLFVARHLSSRPRSRSGSSLCRSLTSPPTSSLR